MGASDRYVYQKYLPPLLAALKLLLLECSKAWERQKRMTANLKCLLSTDVICSIRSVHLLVFRVLASS